MEPLYTMATDPNTISPSILTSCFAFVTYIIEKINRITLALSWKSFVTFIDVFFSEVYSIFFGKMYRVKCVLALFTWYFCEAVVVGRDEVDDCASLIGILPFFSLRQGDAGWKQQRRNILKNCFFVMVQRRPFFNIHFIDNIGRM